MPAPYTDACRPIPDLEETLRAAAEAAGCHAAVYPSTSLDGLAAAIPAALTEAAGRTAAIVFYAGSEFTLGAPRRVSTLQLLLLRHSTTVAPAMHGCLDAARQVAAALDDAITREATAEHPVTEHWVADAEEPMDTGADSAAAILLTFKVEDY